MIPRYNYPPFTILFTDQQKLHRWREASLYLLDGLVEAGVAPRDAYAAALATPTPAVSDVAAKEQEIGHDVAAFLEVWTDLMPPIGKQWVHYGLTSSDIVDAGHHATLYSTASAVRALLENLCSDLMAMAKDHRFSYMVGRTHGQWAEPTTFGHKVSIWASMVNRAASNMDRAANAVYVRKSPGAVGTRSIHIAVPVHMTRSTQVIPRTRQLEWAMAMVQAVTVCESIAMEIRLLSRSEVAEVRERPRLTGSSAMPHKTNPVGSEQITGLGRVARAMLGPILETVTFHGDRDISNSSVERTAVVDLAHLTATIVDKTTRILDRLEVNTARMWENLDTAGWAPYSSLMVACLQEIGWSWSTSHAFVKEAFTKEDPFLHILDGLHEGPARDWSKLMGERANAKWMCRNV